MRTALALTVYALLIVAPAPAAKAPPLPEPSPAPEPESLLPPQFPPKCVILPMTAFANAHAEWALRAATMYPSEANLRLYARGACLRARCWGIARGLTDGWESFAVATPGGGCQLLTAAEGLDELERLLGEDGFRAGWLPPVVLRRD